MATNAKSLIPAVATHPGSVLDKELKARGIKQKDFAIVIGMPASNLNELIKGKRNITEAIAIKLEDALGISYKSWMNLQNRYYYVMNRREKNDANDNNTASKEMPSLIDAIKLRMSEMGLSQAALAKLIGVSPSRICDFLSGKAEPTLKVGRRISTELKIDPAIVLGV